jgi:hypothetical protein
MTDPVYVVDRPATSGQKKAVAMHRARIYDKPIKVDGKSIWPDFAKWSLSVVGRAHISEYTQSDARLVLDRLSRMKGMERVAA